MFENDEDLKSLQVIFRSYFRRFAAQYLLVGVLIAVSAGTTAATAFFVKDVVNSLFVEKNYFVLYAVVFGVIILFSIRGASMYIQSVITTRISSQIVADVQSTIMDHILSQRVRYFQKYSSDKLVMMMNQGASSYRSILSNVVLNGARDVVTVVCLFFVMLIQDPVLTLICATTIPPVFFGVNILLRKMKKISELELKSYAELNKDVREAVQGATLIRSYNLQKHIKSQAEDVIRSLQMRTNKIAVLQAAPIPLLDAFGGIAVASAILYAGLRSSSGGYDAGTFMSFLTALLLAADPSRRISQLRVNLRKALIGVRMVLDLLSDVDAEPVERFQKTVPSCPKITFENLSFQYKKNQAVLSHLNFTVASGETVALVGPSGAGKSTVFSLLLKFYEDYSGVILLDETDLRELDHPTVRDSIAYVGQSNFILSATLRHNLTLGREGTSESEIIDICDKVGLKSYLDSLPNGLDTFVGELGSTISGGQAQRVNIARAMLKKSSMLLLDEVTSALDADNEVLVKNYVASQRGAKTILIIAHRLSTVRDADRILVLDGGCLVAQGSHTKLMSDSTYYRRIVELQLAA